MQNNRRKKRANEFVISIAMHLALFGLLIWSSLYQTVEIMGGGEGEGDAMGAVMVDTGSAAQEWGRIQQQKKGQTDKQKKPEPVVEEKKPEPEPEPSSEPPPLLSSPSSPVSAPFTISVLETCSFEIPFTFFTCAVIVTEEDGSPSSTFSQTPDFVFVIVVSFEILSLSFHVTLL